MKEHSLLGMWNMLSANWIIHAINRVVLLLFIGSILLILLRWRSLPPQIPLFYSRPWGEEQLVHPAWLFLLPLSPLAWYGVNILIAVYITREFLIFTQTLFLTSLITSILSFVTLLKILFLVS